MPKLQPEESNKNRLALIADNELRGLLTKEEAAPFMKWWGQHRTEVGWKRLAKLLTVYAKEFQQTYIPKEKIQDDEKLGNNGIWITTIGELIGELEDAGK